MRESLLSVGIDIGTTTTQLIVSRLGIENTSGPFAVPKMAITHREIVYCSPVYVTPLRSGDTIDGEKIRNIVDAEYAKAQITAGQIDTGAVIITGETARKENAAEVLSALSDHAGEFVVATAGPALESVLAARGAGADVLAKEQGRYVLHMDMGGGTTNLALFDPDGKLVDTGCLNVGGRLMKFDQTGAPTYISPVLREVDTKDPKHVAALLVQVLEEAVGLRPKTELMSRFITDKTVKLPKEEPILSFSGGVADLIQDTETNWLRYGDLGVLLGRKIKGSLLCEKPYYLGRETIRATVIGAGSYTTELSGSTIWCRNVDLPLQDLPVVIIDGLSSEQIRQHTAVYEGQRIAYALQGGDIRSVQGINEMADRVIRGISDTSRPLILVMEQDLAKALGQALTVRLGQAAPILCLDGIHIPQTSYLDVAKPVGEGAAVPVVVKTLAF